jgi:hypothetical protein
MPWLKPFVFVPLNTAPSANLRASSKGQYCSVKVSRNLLNQQMLAMHNKIYVAPRGLVLDFASFPGFRCAPPWATLFRPLYGAGSS